ncbi:MAG TPA: hypothetical protein PLU24_06180 [Candidatus Omnitrophota bacterium]|nr:hypothetical protein [Candidatus Omnitrophota bacterium]
MEDILLSLEREHRSIEDLIRELSSLKGSDPINLKSVSKLEAAILNHISKEDSTIYIPLKKIVKVSDEALKFLEFSRQKLEDLKILSIVFFEKYKGNISAAWRADFKRDLMRLAKKIDERIRFEDRELFPFLKNLWSRL